MITNITSVSIKNCIVDEAHLRESTSNTVDLTSTKETWQTDSILMPKFKGNLEAGNIDNDGLEIESFLIRRRKEDEPTSILIANIAVSEAGELEFTDYTQSNDKLIYTIIPVSSNGIEGQHNDISVESDFAGWYIFDKDTNKRLQFDKFIGSGNNVDTAFNQQKIQIDTMSPYPTIYTLPQAYHTFSLSTVVLTTETERSGYIYNQILNDFIKQNKPFLVKGSSGESYVCSLSNLRKLAPQNAYKGYDYMTITVDATEIMDVNSYVEEG